MAETGPTSYDGFLSYSHAADDLLAPRLQAGLQRFAKPWWRRRALHIFRDEASLSANPHLWSSITDALDDSDWFVLLLSPEAADSVWVNREIDYWKEHRDPLKILPVVTDGEFGWSDGDVGGNAVPDSLLGVFADEPRWVDLRFARTETQLDLRHTRFRDAIADIAAAVRGVPKDELESEEIHQHRRTVRTAWTAGIAILALGVAATVGAVVAYNAQQDAEASAALAEEEAARAEEQARLARARELSSAALVNLASDPERSLLLALEAVGLADTGDGFAVDEPLVALRRALAAHRVTSRLSGVEYVDWSPTGSALVMGLPGSDGGLDAAIWDAVGGEVIRVLPSPDGVRVGAAVFSSDGERLLVMYRNEGPNPAGPTPLALVWDVASGEAVLSLGSAALTAAEVPAGGFSPDDESVAISTEGPLVVWDARSGAERYRIDQEEGAIAHGQSFSPDGSLMAVAHTGMLTASHVILYEASTGLEVDSLDVGELNPEVTAFDPEGRFLAWFSTNPPAVGVWDVESRSKVWTVQLDAMPTTLDWSPDGEVVAISGSEGVVRMFDAATGLEVMTLTGHDGSISSIAFQPGGESLIGVGPIGATVWSVGPAGSREVATLTTPYDQPWKEGIRYTVDGSSILVSAYDRGRVRGRLARLNATTGVVEAEIPDQLLSWPVVPILAPEAGLVVSVSSAGSELRDADTFEVIESLPEDRYALSISPDRQRIVLMDLDGTDSVVAEVGSFETICSLADGPIEYAPFSPDGSLVPTYGWPEARLGNVTITDVDQRIDLLDSSNSSGDVFGPFSPDGSLMVVRNNSGGVGMIDVSALREGATVEAARLFYVDAHTGVTANLDFSPDGSLLATWGLVDKHVRVWSTEDGHLVADLGETEVTYPGLDFHPNGRHIIVTGANGTIRVQTLDTTELLDIARSRLTRSFTDDECATHHIDPCPELETIRGG